MMAKLRDFNFTLQKQIRRDDSAWDYTIPNLPSTDLANASRLVKSIALYSTPRSQTIKLHMATAPCNRVTSSDSLDRFLLISFAAFRLGLGGANERQHIEAVAALETAEYISRLLKTGVIINKVHYHFFGHSNTQLKSRSCFMFAASKGEVSSKVEALGDFSAIYSASKKAKRIGLLFSVVKIAVELDPSRVEDIPDIQRGNHIYTDGCGFISSSFAKQLTQTLHIVHRNISYMPSVYQIRYRGYKGVLMLAPELPGRTFVQFRSSMRKFRDVKDFSFGLIEHSKVSSGNAWPVDIQS